MRNKTQTKTYRTLQIGKDKVSTVLLAGFVRKVKDGPVLAAELSVHNAQVGLVCPPEDVGTLGGVDINKLPPHGTLGAVHCNLLLGVVDVLNVKDGIAGGERRPLAQHPALGIEAEEAGLLLGLPSGVHAHRLGLADADGRIAAVAADVPSGRHGGPESVEGGLLPVKVSQAGQDAGGGAGHGIVHPATYVVRAGRRRPAVADGRRPAVQRPVRRGRLRLALVLVLGRGEFETYSEHGAGVHLPGVGELPPPARPAVAIGARPPGGGPTGRRPG